MERRRKRKAKDSNEISYFVFTDTLDLADGSIEVNPTNAEDEKDAACEGMHSFCTGHKTFLRC